MYDESQVLLLLIHAGATLAMTGLIWFVQIVHYPLFRFVGEPEFGEYHPRHAYRTSLVVTPLMGIELMSAISIAMAPPIGIDPTQAKVGAALVIAIWCATAFLSVPLHTRLGKRFDPRHVDLLVTTNWVRTALWTLRVPLVGCFLLDHLAAITRG